MARSEVDLTEELWSWPENGGFQHDRLIELLAEYERRIEQLENLAERAEPPAPEGKE